MFFIPRMYPVPKFQQVFLKYFSFLIFYFNTKTTLGLNGGDTNFKTKTRPVFEDRAGFGNITTRF